MQRYICNDCRYSFVGSLPNYGYAKYFPEDVRKKGIRSGIKTSFRKDANLFLILRNMMISHDAMSKCVPPVKCTVMESSGHSVYDKQYVQIDGKEKFSAMLKNSHTGNFVESILVDLSKETLIYFFVQLLQRFRIDSGIYVAIDGFHYSTVPKKASSILCIRIGRQRCLFHTEKDLLHRITNSDMENDLDMANKLIKSKFFKNEKNINTLGKNSESMRDLIRERMAGKLSRSHYTISIASAVMIQ